MYKHIAVKINNLTMVRQTFPQYYPLFFHLHRLVTIMYSSSVVNSQNELK